MTKQYRVTFEVDAVSAESKQEAAEMVKDLLTQNLDVLWSWIVVDPDDPTDKEEIIDA